MFGYGLRFRSAGSAMRNHAARGARDLQAGEDYDVVVLGEALSQAKLVKIAGLTRRRWPQAHILAVSGKPLDIDDALYDDRILPGYGAKVLVAEVLRMMDEHAQQREGITSRWEC